MAERAFKEAEVGFKLLQSKHDLPLHSLKVCAVLHEARATPNGCSRITAFAKPAVYFAAKVDKGTQTPSAFT